jgi:hypothetical protein
MKMKRTKAWQDAVDVEIDTLRSNCTLLAAQKPDSVRPLTPRGFSRQNSTRTVELHASKPFVACGSERQAAFNDNDTFAHVLFLATARSILALSVICHSPAHHGDKPAA